MSKFHKRYSLVAHLLIFLQIVCPTYLFALPSDGQVVGGDAVIQQPSPNELVIQQSSDKTILHWEDFSIQSHEGVEFKQPSSSSTALNRVQGSKVSEILGRLSANGNIFLINPNGIIFGQSSRVDVNGLVASTSDIHDDDFMAGRYNFNIPSPKNAFVVNKGQITAAEAGLVALVAPGVDNSGVIQAKLGKVTLASGEVFTVDLYGDELIQLEVDSEVAQQVIGPDGTPLKALVNNSGEIYAEAGTVILEAQAAKGIVDQVINNDGIIDVQSIQEEEGVIVLRGGDNGEVRVAGTLDASGLDDGEEGGTIHILGNEVNLDGAQVNASGDSGGGTVLVGGDRQGQNPNIQNANNTIVSESSSIKADAINKGDGGKIIIWSENSTKVYASLSAKGGSSGGDGGFVETSGKKFLDVTKAPIVSATNGKAGTWLLDPTNIEIVSGPGNGDGSQVSVTTIETALNAGTSVHIITSGQGLEKGTITVSTAILKSSGGDTSLTLTAHGDIVINDTITSTNGTLDVNLIAGADIFINAAIATNGGLVMADAGSIDLPANISGSYTPAARICGSNGALPKIEINADITTSGGAVSLGQFKTKQHSLIGGGTYTKDKHAVTDVTVQTASIDTGGGDFTINGSAISVASTATVTSTGGNIFIEGEGDTIVNISGLLNAANLMAGQTGGVVHVLGHYVGITDNALITVEGDAGGGTILIGGDFQGKNQNIQNAYRTYIGTDVTLKADAITTGDGGTVIVWADDVARFYGTITATGGSVSGDGGLVETSGKGFLDAQGFVNTLAVNGNIGTWLLDPTDVVVVNGGGAALTGVDQFADAGATVNIDASTINAAASNVTIQANNNITINEAISISTAGITLTLQAGDDIIVNQNVTTNNAAISFTANDAGGSESGGGTDGVITMADGAVIDAGNGTITLISTGVGGGDITLGGLTTTNATASAITITTSAGVIDGGDTDRDIVAASGGLVIDAATGIGSADALETQISSIDLDNIGSGNVDISELDAISVTKLNQTASSGNLQLIGGNIMTIAGAVTWNDGDITLRVNGLNSDIQVNAALSNSGSGGTLSLFASDSVIFAAAGDITVDTTSVTITANTNLTAADSGNVITMADGTLINATAGTITLQNASANGGDITLGGLLTTNATASAIRVDSLAGIIDGGDTHVDAVAASGTVVLIGPTGIGSAGSIDITTAALDVDSNQSILVNSSTTLTDLTITLDPGSTADTYTITDGGNLTLSLTDSGTATDIGGISLSAGNLNFTLTTDTGALTTSGAIDINSGNFSVTTTDGSQTYSNTIDANDVTLNADGTNSDVNLQSTITTASGGAVTITADDSVIATVAGDITASGAGAISVTANTNTSNGDSTDFIDMADGTLWDAGSGTISVTTTGTNSGAIFIGGLLTTNATASAVTVATDPGTPDSIINDAGDVHVDIVAANGGLVIDGRGIGNGGGDNNLETTIDSIDLDNLNSGNVRITETDAITITKVNMTSAGGTFFLTAGGTITVSGAVTFDAGGTTLLANGQNSDVLINAAISNSGSGGGLNLTAADSIIFAAAGDITIDIAANSLNITANQDNLTGDSGNVITMNDDTLISATAGTIFMVSTGANAGSITLGGVTNATGDVAVNSAAAIIDGGATHVDAVATSGTITLTGGSGIGSAGSIDVNTATLVLDSNQSILVNSSTTLTDLTITLNPITTADTYTITDGGNLTLSLTDSGTDLDIGGISLSAGNMNFTLTQDTGDLTTSGNIDINSGNFSVTTTDGSQTYSNTIDANNVTLNADGTNSDVNLQSTITTASGGAVTITADDSVIATATGDITASGAGAISVTANTNNTVGDTTDLITMTDGALWDAGSGTISITYSGSSANNFTVGGLTTTNATATAITITGDAAIGDGGNTHVDIVAASGGLVADVRAVGSVGANSIETTLASVDIDTFTAGAIRLNDTDALNITKLNNAATTGSIVVSAGGTMTLTSGQSGVTSVNGDIILTATGTNSDILINAAIMTTAGAVTLTADDSVEADANGDITMSGSAAFSVTANNNTSDGDTGDRITMVDGTVWDAGSGTIALTSTGTNAGFLRLGGLTTTNNTAAAVTINTRTAIVDNGDGAVDIVAASGTVNLISSNASGIGSGNAIEVTTAQLIVDGNGSIEIASTTTLTDLTMTVDPGGGANTYTITDGGNLTLTLTDSGADLDIGALSLSAGNLNFTLTTDTGDLTTGGNIDINSGNFSVTTTDGSQTYSNTIDANDVTLNADGQNSDVNLQSTITTASGGAVTITADDSVIATATGDITASGAGVISVTANTNTSDGDGVDAITMTDGALWNAGSGTITLTATGTNSENIILGGLLTTNSSNTAVTLTTDSLTTGIIDDGGDTHVDIDAANGRLVVVSAGFGATSDNDIETTIDSLDLNNSDARVRISETDAITLVRLDQGSATTRVLVTANGTITVANALTYQQGRFQLIATGQNSDILVNAAISNTGTSTGVFTLLAADSVIFGAAGDITVDTTNTFSITANSDNLTGDSGNVITMNDDTLLNITNAAVSLTSTGANAGSITLGGVTTTNATASAITVTTDAAIIDGGVTHVDAVASSGTVNLIGLTGIGSAGSIDVTTAALVVDSNQSILVNSTTTLTDLTITLDPGSTADTYTITDGGNLTLTLTDSGTATDIGGISLAAGNLNFTLTTDTGALTTSGAIDINSGNFSVTTTDGSQTYSNTIDANDVTLNADGTNSDVNLQSTITTASGGAVTITADDSVIATATGDITSSGAGALSVTANTNTSNGDTDDEITMADGTLWDAGSGTITLVTTGANSTSITLGGLLTTNATATAVTLTTGIGQIVDAGEIDVDIVAASGGLVIDSAAGVGITGNIFIETTVASIDLDNNGGNARIDETDAISVTKLNNTGSTLVLRASGTITITAGQSGVTWGVGATQITALGQNSDILVNAALSNSGSGTSLNINAADSIIFGAAGDITVDNNSISITSNTDNLSGDSGNVVTMNDDTLINATGSTIALTSTGANAGDITLGGLTTTNATASAITVNTDAAIVDGGVTHVDAVASSGTINLIGLTGIGSAGSIDVNTAVLVVDSNQSILVNSTTTLTDLTITLDPGSTADTYTITDGGNLTLALTDTGINASIGGLSLAAGNLNFTMTTDTGALATTGNIDINSGNLSVTTSAGSQTWSNTTDANNVTLNADGQNSDVNVNGNITTVSGGVVTITADDSVSFAADVTANGTGGIVVTSNTATTAGDTGDIITMGAGNKLDSGGTIAVTSTGANAGNISLGRLITTDSSNTAITITAGNGNAILDNNGSTQNAVTTGGRLVIDSINGVGTSGDSLEITVASVDIDNTGSGGIFLTEANGIDIVNLNSSSANGDITLSAAGTINLTVDGAIAAGSGNVALTASAGSIEDTAGTGNAKITTTGTISLTASAGVGQSAVLEIASSANLTVDANQSIQVASTTTLTDLTITLDPGSTADTYTITDGGNLTLSLTDSGTATDIGGISLAAGNLNFTLTTDTGALTTSGNIDINSGNFSVTTTGGSQTYSNTIDANNVTLNADGTNSDVNLQSTITTASGGAVTITADDSVIATATGDITASGAGAISVTANTATTDGDSNDLITMADGTLWNAGSGTITLVTTGTNSTDITLGGLLTTNATATAVTVTTDSTTSGQIIDAGDTHVEIVAASGGLVIDGSNIGPSSNFIETTVDSIDLDNTSTGNVFISETDAITITKYNQTASTGTLRLDAGGTITINGAVTWNAGGVQINANGQNSDILVNAAMSNSGSGGNVSIRADDSVIFAAAGDITADSLTVAIIANNDNLTGDSGNVITMNDDTLINATAGTISLTSTGANAGSITLGGLTTTNATASAISVNSAVAIIDGGDTHVDAVATSGTITLRGVTGIGSAGSIDVNTAALDVESNQSILVNSTTTLTDLTITLDPGSTADTYTITDGGNLTLSLTDSGTDLDIGGISLSAGNLNFTLTTDTGAVTTSGNIDINSGNLSVTTTSGSQTYSNTIDANNVTLNADGQNSDVNVNNTITTVSGGAVTITADDSVTFSVNGDINNSGAGNTSITSNTATTNGDSNDVIFMASGAEFASGTGTITLTSTGANAGDITVGRIVTNNSTNSAITITAGVGAVLDGNTTAQNAVAASGRVVIDAITGVGTSGESLELTVASADIDNTGSGGIFLTELDSIDIVNLNSSSANGDITLSAAGTINLTVDGAIAGGSGNVALTASAGSIEDTAGTGNAKITTTGTISLTASAGVGQSAVLEIASSSNLTVDANQSIQVASTTTLTDLTITLDPGSTADTYTITDGGNLTLSLTDSGTATDIGGISLAAGNLNFTLTTDTGALTTSGNIDVNSGNFSVTTTAGSQTYSNTIDASAVTLTADSGLAINNTITALGNLVLEGDSDNAADTGDAITVAAGLTLTSSGTITMDATTGGITLNSTTLVTSGGVITLNDNVTLATGAVSIDTTNSGGAAAGANINLVGTVQGAQALTLNAGTGGTNNIDGNMGNVTALNGLTVTGAATLSGVTIRTSGDVITFNNAITLDVGATSINTTFGVAAGANLNFNGTINGAQALTLSSGTGGTLNINSTIGNSTALTGLTLISGQNITQSAAWISSGTVDITANISASITLSNTGNNFSGTVGLTTNNGAATINNGANDITLGASTVVGNTDITAGSITVSGALAGSAAITLDANGTNADVNLNAALTAGSGSAVTITADDSVTANANGDITASGAGAISVTANTNTSNGDTGDIITMTDGALWDAGSGTIALTTTGANAGNITLGGLLTTNATASAVTVTADAAIVDGGNTHVDVVAASGTINLIGLDGMGTGGNGAIETNTAILVADTNQSLQIANSTTSLTDLTLTLDPGTTADTYTITDPNATLTLTDSGTDLNIGGISLSAGNMNFTLTTDTGAVTTSGAIDINSGNFSVATTDGSQTYSNTIDANNVTLNADGTNSDVTITAGITTVSGGAVTITADDSILLNNFAADITASGAGNISLTANTNTSNGDTNDVITMVDGAVIDAGSGTITMTATGANGGDITLGGLTTTSASLTAVAIATNAAVVDGGASNVDVRATGGRLVIDAVTGVGSGAALEIDTSSIDIDNTGSNNIALSDSFTFSVVKVSNLASGGTVDLTAGGGSLTIATGGSGVTSTNGAISLTATGTNSDININAAISSGTGAVTLVADDSIVADANGDITKTGTAALSVTANNNTSNGNGGDVITMADGALWDAGGGTIALTSAGANSGTITLGGLTTTNATASAITVTVDTAGIVDGGDTHVDAVAASGTINLTGITGIGFAGSIEVNTAALVLVSNQTTQVNSSTTLTDLTMTLNPASAADTYAITDGGNLTLTLTDSGTDLDIGGISLAAGNLNFTLTQSNGNLTTSGAIDINSGNFSVTTNAGSQTFTNSIDANDVTLNADGTNSDVSLQAVITTASGGAVTITADDSVLLATAAGDITASGAGNVSITANTNTSNGDSGDVITMANASVINAGSGTITLTSTGTNAGDITLGGLTTTNATTSAITLTTAAGIVDGGNTDVDIVAASGRVVIDAVSGIGSGDALEITVSSMDIDNTGSNGIEFVETNDIQVQKLSNLASGGIVSLTANFGSIGVTSGGSGVTSTNGNITLTAGDQNSDIVIQAGISSGTGSVTITADDSVTASANGDITMTGSAALIVTANNANTNGDTGDAITMVDGALWDAGGGTITLTTTGANAGNITLGGLLTTNATASAINVTTDAAIADAGDTFVDAAAASGTVNLTGLTGIGSAGSIEVNTAALVVDSNQSIQVNSSTTLTDLTVTLDPGSTADTYAITDGGNMNLSLVDAGTSISWRVTLTAGNLNYTMTLDTGNATTSGNIDINSGDLSITTPGGIGINAGNTIDANNVTLTATGTNSDVNILGNASITTASGGAVTIAADDTVNFAATGSITAAGAGNISITANANTANGNGGDLIFMGDGSQIDAGSGTITLTTTGTNAGDITVGRLITTNATNSAVTLTTAAGVVDGGDTGGADINVSSGRLVIDAVTGVGSGAALEIDTSSIDIDNTGSNNIALSDSFTFSVVKVSNLASGGTVDLTAAGGSLTIATGGSGVTSTNGAITLTASGQQSDINLNAAISSGTGSVTLVADDSIITDANGDITMTGTAALSVTANNDNLNGLTNDVISMADGALWDAGGGTIALTSTGANAGDVTLGGLTTTNATASAITVTTDTAIVDGGAAHVDAVAGSGTITLTGLTGIGSGGSIDVTTATMIVDSNQSIRFNSSTTLTDLTMTLDPGSTADTYTISDGGNLSLNLTDSGTDLNIGGLSLAAGNLNFTLTQDTGNLTTSGAIDINSGNFSVTTTAGSQTYSNTIDANNVTLNADGTNSDVNISNVVTTVVGASVTITADDSVQFLTATADIISNGAGNTSITANTATTNGDTGDIISMVGGSLINSGSGTITLTSTGANSGDITLGRLLTGNGTGSAITVTAGLGAVLDGNTTTQNFVAASGGVVIDAAAGVGTSGEALELTAASVDIDNTTSGGIFITEVDNINIVNLNSSSGNGDINLSAAGTINLTVDGAIAAGSGNVSLTATAGSIEDTAGTGNAKITTTGSISLIASQGVGQSAVLEIASSSNLTAEANQSIQVASSTTITDLTLTVDPSSTADTYTVTDGGNLTLTLTDSGTDVDIGGISLAAGNLNFTLTQDTGNLTTSGNIDINSGNFSATTTAGSQTYSNTIDANDVTLDANGTNSDLNINNTITTAAGGAVTLTADDSVIFAAGGDITASSAGNVSITANSNNAAGDSFNTVDMADGTVINAGSGTITLTSTGINAGTLDVSGLTTTNATNSAVTLNTNSSITDAGDTNVDVVAANGRVTMTANIGIGSGNALETTVDSLNVSNTVSNNIAITETNDVTVIQLSNTVAAGTIDLTSTAGTITVAAGGSGVATTTGALTLTAGTDINVNRSVTTGSGNITLAAVNDVVFTALGDVTSVSGDITVTADSDDGGVASGALTMVAGTTINAGSGTIALAADEDITLGKLATTNNTLTALTLTSTEGGIVEGGVVGTCGGAISAGCNIVASDGRLVVDTVTGIGSIGALNGNGVIVTPGAIKIDTQSVDIDNTTSGNINLFERATTNIVKVNQAGPGNLTISFDGAPGATLPGQGNATVAGGIRRLINRIPPPVAGTTPGPGFGPGPGGPAGPVVPPGLKNRFDINGSTTRAEIFDLIRGGERVTTNDVSKTQLLGRDMQDLVEFSGVPTGKTMTQVVVEEAVLSNNRFKNSSATGSTNASGQSANTVQDAALDSAASGAVVVDPFEVQFDIVEINEPEESQP